MTREILFVQGGGEGAHDEWDSKLVESLQNQLGPQYKMRYPKMPNEADPNYGVWKAALEKEIERLGDGAVLVGHSVGGTILIHFLAEQTLRRKPAAILLIATPFIGKEGWSSEDIPPQPDLGARLPPNVPLFLYHGTSDETAPPAHAELYAAAIPQAQVRLLDGRDHQLNNDLSEVAVDIRSLTK